MSITATEFKKSLSKYLSMAETEDIYITKNGHIVAKLCNPNLDRVQDGLLTVLALFQIL